MPRAKKIEAEDILAKYDINLEQEMFCQYFTAPSEFFGNGVQAYAAAYDFDIGNPKDYNTAKAAAWTLLSNVKIIKRINSMLDTGGFNDMNADKQLLFLMMQNSDYHSKLGALKEYNKLKSRIIERMDHHISTPVTGFQIVSAADAVRDTEEDEE